MPFLVALVGLLGQALASYVPRVLMALGISFVAYQGFDVLLSQLSALVASQGAGLPSYAVGFLGLVHLGAAFNIVMSAVTAKWIVNGLSASITRMKVG